MPIPTPLLNRGGSSNLQLFNDEKTEVEVGFSLVYLIKNDVSELVETSVVDDLLQKDSRSAVRDARVVRCLPVHTHLITERDETNPTGDRLNFKSKHVPLSN